MLSVSSKLSVGGSVIGSLSSDLTLLAKSWGNSRWRMAQLFDPSTLGLMVIKILL